MQNMACNKFKNVILLVMLIKICITEVIEFTEPDYKVEFELSDAPDYKVEFELSDSVASETNNDNYESANSWGTSSGYENRQAVEVEEVLFQICLKLLQNKIRCFYMP